MAAIYKKDARGRIMVKKTDGPPILMIGSGFRMRDEVRVDIRHFINPQSGECWWVLSRLVTSMLTDSLLSNTLYCRDKNAGSPQLTQYDEPCVIYLKNFKSLERPVCLTNPTAGVLSGSNIYGNSFGIKANHLCLGEGPNPFTFHPVDMLLYNTANRDLPWIGGEISGQLQTQPNGPTIFKISTWPSYLQLPSYPDAILDAIAALSNT